MLCIFFLGACESSCSTDALKQMFEECYVLNTKECIFIDAKLLQCNQKKGAKQRNCISAHLEPNLRQ